MAAAWWEMKSETMGATSYGACKLTPSQCPPVFSFPLRYSFCKRAFQGTLHWVRALPMNASSPVPAFLLSVCFPLLPCPARSPEDGLPLPCSPSHPHWIHTGYSTGEWDWLLNAGSPHVKGGRLSLHRQIQLGS